MSASAIDALVSEGLSVRRSQDMLWTLFEAKLEAKKRLESMISCQTASPDGRVTSTGRRLQTAERQAIDTVSTYVGAAAIISEFPELSDHALPTLPPLLDEIYSHSLQGESEPYMTASAFRNYWMRASRMVLDSMSRSQTVTSAVNLAHTSDGHGSEGSG